MEKDNEYVEYIFEIKRKDALALLEALYFKTEIPRTVAISSTPLVRCKDCVYSIDYYNDGDCYCKLPCKDMIYIGSQWDFFCANGERRENDETN